MPARLDQNNVAAHACRLHRRRNAAGVAAINDDVGFVGFRRRRDANPNAKNQKTA